MHTFWAPGRRRDGLAPLLTAQRGCQVSLCLCGAAVAPRLQGLYRSRAGSTSGSAGRGNQKSRRKRGEEGKGTQRKGQASTSRAAGERRGGKGGGRSRAQPEPSEQRNRGGRGGDGRCRLAVAKGGGHVPRDGTLTAPARGKPLLSILQNTAGRKRHPRGTVKEHGHKAAIEAEAHPRLEPPKTTKRTSSPVGTEDKLSVA